MAVNRRAFLADDRGRLEQSLGLGRQAVDARGPDVDLKFGTRATFDNVAIGSITCDQTVLSRGTTVCP